MLEIGSVVEATVERVEVYGLFLKHGKETVVVLAPDVSWVDKRDLRTRFAPGQVLKAVVLRYNYADNVSVGSIRRLNPEDNPYRKLSRLRPGRVLQGRITSLLGDEITVSLANGAWGHVAKRDLKREVERGQKVHVTISGLDVEEGRLWLRLAKRGRAKAKKTRTGRKHQLSQ